MTLKVKAWFAFSTKKTRLPISSNSVALQSNLVTFAANSVEHKGLRRPQLRCWHFPSCQPKEWVGGCIYLTAATSKVNSTSFIAPLLPGCICADVISHSNRWPQNHLVNIKGDGAAYFSQGMQNTAEQPKRKIQDRTVRLWLGNLESYLWLMSIANVSRPVRMIFLVWILLKSLDVAGNTPRLRNKLRASGTFRAIYCSSSAVELPVILMVATCVTYWKVSYRSPSVPIHREQDSTLTL